MKAYFDASQIAGINVNQVSAVDSIDALIAAYTRKIQAIKGPERAALDVSMNRIFEFDALYCQI